VAALSAPEARGDLPAERFTWLRELGSRSVATWAAVESLPKGRTQLVVIERIPRHGALDDVAVAGLVRAGRALASLQHPNVARTRDVVSRSNEVLVVREFIEGVSWADVAAAAQPPPLEIALRMLVEVLSGLSALHTLRDSKRQPLGLFHGGLTPDCVFVAPNGSIRFVVPSRLPSTALRSSHADQAYLAPEVLLDDDQADLRADIYSVGVLLWESLTRKRLFANVKPSAIVTQLLSNKVPAPTAPPDAPWATALTALATRALSVDPQARFATASAMAIEVRRAAAAKLALSTRVGAFVKGAFAETLKTRREEFDRALLALREAPAVATPNSVSDIPISIDELSSEDLPEPSSAPEAAGIPPAGRAAPRGNDAHIPRAAPPRPPPPLLVASPGPPAAPRPVPVPAPPGLFASPTLPPAPQGNQGKMDVPTPITPIVVLPQAAVGSIPPPEEYDAADTSRHGSKRILVLGTPIIVALVGVVCWLAWRPAPHPAGAGNAVAAPRTVPTVTSSPSNARPLANELAPETTARVTVPTGESGPTNPPSDSAEAASARSGGAPSSVPSNAKAPNRAKRAYDPQGI